jgi:alpha-N-arabinofuranosidase
MGKLRAENGHPEPYGVKRWEIGNEPFIPGQVTDYALTIDAYSNAVRKADPGILLGGAGWHRPGWLNHYHPDTVPWNETLLELAGDHFDCLIVHSYAWIDKKPENVDEAFIEAVLSYPNRLGEWLDENDALLGEKGYSGMGYWFTEHNGYYGEKGMSPLLCQAFNGVLNARMLMQYVRHGVELACYWNAASNGWGHFSALALPGLDPQHFQKRPAYYVYRLFGNVIGDQVLKTDVQGPTYTTRRVGTIPGGEGNPYFDALATLRKDGSVGLFLANASATTAIAAEIDGLRGEVTKVTLFSGESPQSGRYGLSEIEVERSDSGASRCVLPPASVAGIVFATE